MSKYSEKTGSRSAGERNLDGRTSAARRKMPAPGSSEKPRISRENRPVLICDFLCAGPNLVFAPVPSAQIASVQNEKNAKSFEKFATLSELRRRIKLHSRPPQYAAKFARRKPPPQGVNCVTSASNMRTSASPPRSTPRTPCRG
jgi:hypothetical protein